MSDSEMVVVVRITEEITVQGSKYFKEDGSLDYDTLDFDIENNWIEKQVIGWSKETRGLTLVSSHPVEDDIDFEIEEENV